MATLQEVESEIKAIAAKINELKAAGGTDPAVIKQHVVSASKGLVSIHTFSSFGDVSFSTAQNSQGIACLN